MERTRNKDMNLIEAVIISGPRKGEIAQFREEQIVPDDASGSGHAVGVADADEVQLSPEEEAMLDFLAHTMQSTARHAQEAAQSARRLREKLEAAQKTLAKERA